MAGGNSKYVNIYEIRHRILMKKYILTNNRSLDGILAKLNSKNIKNSININEIDMFSDSDYENRCNLFKKDIFIKSIIKKR